MLDINECLSKDGWAIGPGACVERRQCVNTKGSFICCPKGYQNTNPENGTLPCTGNVQNLSKLHFSRFPCWLGTQRQNYLCSFVHVRSLTLTSERPFALRLLLDKFVALGLRLPKFLSQGTQTDFIILDINECIDGGWDSPLGSRRNISCLSVSTCLNLPGTFDCCDSGFESSDDYSRCVGKSILSS